MKFKLTTLCLIMLATKSFAFPHRESCLTDDKVYLRTEVENGAVCTLESPLTPAEGLFAFPKLKDSPYRVKYWKGSWLKPITEKYVYWQIISNICTREVVYQGEFTEKFVSYERFSIKNPNLSEDIDSTINLLPMTELEAQAAMQATKTECEAQ